MDNIARALGKTVRVLIVEDERPLANSIRRVLERAGFEISGNVPSAAEALACLDHATTDLLITDIDLGAGGDGADLAHQAWVTRRTPTVFLTAYADSQTLNRAIRPGVVGYVTKPFYARQLLSTISVGLATARIASAIAPQTDVDPIRREALGACRERVRSLSKREREVLVALLANRRVTHIAEQLFISPHTVRNHLKSIFRKVGVSSQAELVGRLAGLSPWLFEADERW